MVLTLCAKLSTALDFRWQWSSIVTKEATNPRIPVPLVVWKKVALYFTSHLCRRTDGHCLAIRDTTPYKLTTGSQMEFRAWNILTVVNNFLAPPRTAYLPDTQEERKVLKVHYLGCRCAIRVIVVLINFFIATEESLWCTPDLHCGDFCHVWCSEYCGLEWHPPQDQHVWWSISVSDCFIHELVLIRKFNLII